VEKSGIPVAGIVSVEDLQRLDRLDLERAEKFQAIKEFAAGFVDQSPEEIERETARAIAEVRAERFRILEEFGEAFKDIPAEELEREVERSIAEVRAERRAEQEAALAPQR
jgi:hypothetical protein